MDNGSTVSRRDLLKIGTAAAVAGAVGGLSPAQAQTPTRGGIFRIRHHVQPVHFDPHATIAFSTEYGAFVSSTIFGKFDRMAGGLFGATTDPDAYVYRTDVPGQPLNAGGVDDPKATEMIRLQRRTFDVAKRRDILWDLQRYLSQQAYYLYGPSVSAMAAWMPYVRNYGPNIGHDMGGRMMAAWLDK